jgi:hypothetical protein
MAVAAAEREQAIFDFQEWEMAMDGYNRPPEAEVYGRSLSTIYRLGAYMVGKVASEVTTSPEADQARVEFCTSVEEGFGTDKKLGGGLEVRDFDVRPVMNGRVMAKDLKTAVSDMTRAGLVCGIKTAEQDARFAPQLTRSKWDHENAVLVDKMARGETGYKTRIVVSPFPEEAAQESGEEYWQNIGYVPHLKRGFVQLYHVGENGVIAGSLSFDGCSKTRLREVFGKYGVEIPEDEVSDNWLQYAITDTLSDEAAMSLAQEIADQAGDPSYKKRTNTVDVTREYGAVMESVFNESYVHVCESLFKGHQTPAASELITQLAHNAHHFNDHYKAALYKMRADTESFSDDDATVLHELLVYSTIEMMRALHVRTKQLLDNPNIMSWKGTLDVAYLQSLDAASFQNMLSGFGADGAKNNRTYSACGLSISLGGPDGSGDPQSIFGGAENSLLGEDKFGPLRFQCKNGHWNKRPRNALIKQCRVKSCKNSVGC